MGIRLYDWGDTQNPLDSLWVLKDTTENLWVLTGNPLDILETKRADRNASEYHLIYCHMEKGRSNTHPRPLLAALFLHRVLTGRKNMQNKQEKGGFWEWITLMLVFGVWFVFHDLVMKCVFHSSFITDTSGSPINLQRISFHIPLCSLLNHVTAAISKFVNHRETFKNVRSQNCWIWPFITDTSGSQINLQRISFHISPPLFIESCYSRRFTVCKSWENVQ